MNANLQATTSGIFFQPVLRLKNSLRPVALESGATRSLEQAERLYPDISVPESAPDAEGTYRQRRGYYKAASSHEEKVSMYARAAEIQNLLVTWMLVADDRKAQIYECYKPAPAKAEETGKPPYYDEQSGQAWAPVTNGFIKGESVWDYHIKSEWNNADSSGDLVRNTEALRHVVQEELNRQFLRTIAGKLQQAYAANAFDRLIFSVPAAMIAELKGRLTFNVQDCIVAAHGY